MLGGDEDVGEGPVLAGSLAQPAAAILSEGHREWCPDESGSLDPRGTHCCSWGRRKPFPLDVCDDRGRGAGPRYGTARLHGLRQSGFAVPESTTPPRERALRQAAGKLPASCHIFLGNV